MLTREEKAVRLIQRLRAREAAAHEAMIVQAHIISEIDIAREDLVTLATKPLHFLRALLGEARELLGPDCEILLREGKDLMCIQFNIAKEGHAFEVTTTDYDKDFATFLGEIDQSIKGKS